jgi:hypothetical protein
MRLFAAPLIIFSPQVNITTASLGPPQAMAPQRKCNDFDTESDPSVEP